MTTVLETRGLRKTFGGFIATNDVSLTLTQGERHALIGPNGAGKTTLINLLTGVLAPTEGAILLDGVDVTKAPRHERVKRGLVRTFQINQLFPDLTPLESVLLAIHEREGTARRFLSPVGTKKALTDEAADLLDRLGLARDMTRRTGDLAYGRQRLVEVAIALACKPKVLLLDEPAAGVPKGESEDILAMIADLPKDVTVLMIEHDMDLVFRFAERITVLVSGAIAVEGTPESVRSDPKVREVYLGSAGHG